MLLNPVNNTDAMIVKQIDFNKLSEVFNKF